MKTKIPHLILAGLFGTAIASQGATIIAIDDANFARLISDDQDGAGDSGRNAHTLWVGTKPNNSGWDMHVGLAFQMTGAADGYLEAADFSVSLTGKSDPSNITWNVDVYATRVSSTTSFVNADFQNGTKLMDDFVTTSDGNGNYSLDATGQANLLSYLQSDWVEDDYLFITLKANTDPGFIMGGNTSTAYLFGGTVGFEEGGTDAQLFVTVPEPSSTALLGLGGLAFALRRRRA